MDRMTALRTFAQPSYTPTKHIRIYANRWYLVTMQNVEHDSLTDYHGLAPGEYTELVTGTEARYRRDAHLNHCNAVRQYDGPVYQVDDIRYVGRVYRTVYITDTARVDILRAQQMVEEQCDKSEAARHISESIRRRDMYASGAPIPGAPTISDETRARDVVLLDQTIPGMTEYARTRAPWVLAVKVIRA